MLLNLKKYCNLGYCGSNNKLLRKDWPDFVFICSKEVPGSQEGKRESLSHKYRERRRYIYIKAKERKTRTRHNRDKCGRIYILSHTSFPSLLAAVYCLLYSIVPFIYLFNFYYINSLSLFLLNQGKVVGFAIMAVRKNSKKN